MYIYIYIYFECNCNHCNTHADPWKSLHCGNPRGWTNYSFFSDRIRELVDGWWVLESPFGIGDLVWGIARRLPVFEDLYILDMIRGGMRFSVWYCFPVKSLRTERITHFTLLESLEIWIIIAWKATGRSTLKFYSKSGKFDWYLHPYLTNDCFEKL